MKSIISRYGEMTSDPNKLMDSEGEEMSLNKVDKALQSVGITIQDTNHQFRAFDDVITELADKWNTIDTNTQRYIATVMAGNRQQSRFLALVSNGERLTELSEKAANAEDTATLQVLKTMDSIEAKTQQLQTSLQSLYTDTGIQDFYKDILDFGNNVIKTFTEMPRIFNLPIPAIAKFGSQFYTLSSIVLNAFSMIKAGLNKRLSENNLLLKKANGEELSQAEQTALNRILTERKKQEGILREQRKGQQESLNAQREADEAQITEAENAAKRQEEAAKKQLAKNKGLQIGGMIANSAGIVLSGIAGNMDVNQDRKLKAGLTGASTALQGIGTGLMIGGVSGAIVGALSALPGIIEAIGIAGESTEEKIISLKQNIENAKNEELKSKDELKTLTDYKKKYDELYKTRNKDAESKEEWIKLNNDIAAAYPELISQMNAEGNSIVDMTNAYENLLKIKRDVYQQDFLNSIQAELNGLNDIDYILSSTFEMDPLKRNTGIDALFNGTDLRSIGEIYQGYQKGSGIIPSTRANADTYAAVFGIKNEKELEGFDRQSSGNVLNNYRSLYDKLINLMYEKASEGLSKAAAAEQIMTEHPELEAFSSNLEYFDQSLYNYFLNLNGAITYQQQLIDSKISQGNAQWLQALQGITGIEYNDIQFSQLQKIADEEWKRYQETYVDKIEEDPQKYHKIDSEVDGKIWSLGDIYSQFIQEKLDTEWYNLQVKHLDYLADETINELYKNLGKSNRTDIKFGLGKYRDLSDEMRQILLDEFDKQYEDSINTFKQNILELQKNTSDGALINDLRILRTRIPRLFGPEFLDGIATQFNNILDNTKTSDFNKDLQFDGLMQIYNTISTLDENSRQAALSIAEGADFTSLIGIHEFIKSLEDAEIDLDATGLKQIIRDFGQTLSLNFEVEVQSYITKVTSGLEDFDKALNSASKGMDFKAASELANKLNKNLTKDFDLHDGQYFFSDFAAIREHFLQANDSYLNDLKEAQNAELAKFEKIGPGIKIISKGEEKENRLWKDFNTQEELDKFLSSHQQAIESYTGLDISNISDAWQQWHQQAVEGENDFIQWLSDEYNKQYDEATEAGTIYANQRIASMALSNGNIDAFLEAYKALGKTINEKAAKKAFNSENIDQLIEMFPEFASILIEKYQNISLDIYNQMLSATEEGSYITIDPNNTRQKELLERLAKEANGLVEKTANENVYKLQEITEENINTYLAEIDNSNLTDTEKIKARADATKNLYENSADKLIEDIIKNRSAISAEAFERIRQEYLKIEGNTEEAFNELFTDNKDSTYSIDLTQIQNLYNQLGVTLSDAAKELYSSEIDKIISSITGLAGSQSKGYTNLGDMQKYVNELNKVTNANYGFRDLFEYSDTLHAYQLSTQGLIAQIKGMKNQLSTLTDEEKEITKQLINDTTRQLAELIDISGYLKLADDDPAKAIKEEEIKQSIVDYNAAIYALGEGTILHVNEIINNLKEGGLNAVEAARAVAEAAGKTLTAEEVKTAYRGQVIELTNALEQLISGPGAIVDNTVAEILRESGYGIQEIEGTGQSLITSVGKLNVAYRDYLNRLEKTNEATLAELNEATANVLENNKREENDVINALSKAVSMSYSEFSEIFTNAGIRLTEQMVNQLEDENIIKRLGGGKMQIIDFKSFADLMDWDTNADSEEYISAFRAYNDALIELNRKTEKVITDEIKSISEAKAGDQINLTQLSVELGDTLLAEIVDKYGAYLSEGILTLGNDANIPALIREIAQEAANKGLLLEDTMADLADTLNDVLQKYTDLINNGIVGQLTNVEAQQLQTQANSLGFKGKLDFKETANGLKLSEQSAASLYNHLKSVDTIQSHLVLNKLYDSITSSEGKLKTMSKTMVTIDNIQKKITENEERITKLRDSGKNNRADQIQEENNKLKDQLQLYKDIRMEQMDDPDSYSFMDKELPNSFKGPQNYWNSVGKAFTAINQAGESGYMEIADFYNFINEATNLVQMSGQSIDLWGMQIDGSAETAANLIEKGFGALSNIDGEGVKIDLTRLGVDFSKGADGMASGFTAGIKSLAKSQIALIDAEIAMLETFVAMEALGDIDVDKNGVFDFVAQELGTLDEQGEYIERFGIGYKNAISKIKKYFETSTNKDIQNAYKNFKINGHSIEELLNASEGELKNWGIKGKTLQTLLHKFYELSQSDEFSTDPGEIWKQLAKALSDEDLADLDFTFYSPEIGQITIENGNKFGIDFESATAVAAKEFLKEHGKNGEDLNKELEEAFEKYQAGTSNEVELTAVLMAKGIVETKDDGLYVNNEGPFKNEEDPKYKEAIARAALKDIGITGDIVYDAGTGTATGKYRIGTREIVATSKDGKITYYSDMDGANPSGYGTPEELMQAEYKLTMKSIPENQQYSENEFRHERYGYKLEIEATLETKIDEEGLKVQAIEALSKPASIIKACIEDPENESYKTISSNGETITYDLNGIIVTVDNIGSLDQQIAAAQEKISGIVDPDGLILKISTSIQNAFQNLNIAQLFIDGLTTSLQVHSENGTIQFTSNPTITALGANLGQGIAASIASASSNSIKNFFGNDNNISTIATPIQEGVEGVASSATVTDTRYEIPHATATLKKMDINKVEAASLSSSTLGELLKTVSSIFGGSSSDLTLESATAAIKKLSVQSVGETDLQTQIQTEIVAKVGSVDVSSIITAQQEIVNAIGNISNTFVILKNRIADLNTNSVNANASISNLKTSLIDVANSQGPAQVAAFKNYLNAIDSSGPNRAFSFKEAVNAIASYGPSYAADFVRSVNNMQPKTVQLRGRLYLDAYINTSGDINANVSAHTNASFAKGNVGIKNSSPKGKNKTLMGELGPELVVSNGRYYVVGENGAEMVDLPDDAIVFNHLQTKKLLANGKGGRGTPVTNEKNAVSYATGNVSGPALVTAKQAIASLKQLRAMWQAMLTATAKQLGAQAGKSKNKTKTGSSKGDNGDGTTTADNGTRIKTAVYEIQRWYNLLRQIDKTEKDITYQEKLQTQYQSLRVADGKSLYKSYKTELSMLGDQINRSKELAKIQKSWYDDKRAELAASPYGKIFTYTEDGLQQYVEGRDRGVDFLSELFETDNYGNPTGWGKTSATQLQYIQRVTGINLNDLLANNDGTLVASYASSINHIVDENGEVLTGQKLIDAQTEMVNNFIDFADDWRDELDGLYDSYREQLTNVIDNQNKQNEIMQKVVDNQIEVENKVYNALIDAKQAIIDNAQKEMETYQKNTDDMIDSLNKTLDKERQLYDNQKNSDDLLKLQRQLAILQRSGGSTSQIVNLQQQIATKQQDMYFEEKEEQIKALQEASDLQLKKMQEQIDLMTETLEYQKQNGLLWEEIAAIMRRDPQDILGFITDNSADWNSQSALQISQSIAEWQTKIEVYTNSRDEDFISYYNDISSNIKDIANTTTNISNGIRAAGTTSNGYVYGVRNVYKEGGLIDFTGPAWVDGTPSQPEAVLNANETKFVQNKLPNILNSADTLQERVKDLQNLQTDWLSNISNIINNNDQNNSVNIEHVELNMNVEQMSNSADAKKLGREAFDELLNIARKTGKNSVSRR